MTTKNAAAIESVKAMKISELVPHDKNPRRGNVSAIKASLERFGQYAPVVVDKTTKRILKGNHTVQAAKELGWDTVKAAVVDYNDADQLGVLLADNRTSDLGVYSMPSLAELLADVSDNDTLDGIGYSFDEASKIIEKYNPVDDINVPLAAMNTPAGTPVASAAAAYAPGEPQMNVSAQVRMLSLFFSTAEYDEMQENIETLKEHYGVDNPSEAVRRAVEDATKAV